MDVTAQAAFTTSNPKVATVDSTGTVTAVSPGTAVITAQYRALVATLNVTVGLTLKSIAVTPAPVILASGATQQLKITAAFNDGSMQDVTGSATYASSSTAVATVNAAGLVTAVSTGAATITASYQGQTATAQITVTAATLSAIALTSSSDSLAPGATAQLTATGTYSDGSKQTFTSGVTFTSDNPAAATVNAAGLVTAVSTGAATITASYQGQTATVQITVTAATLSSIALSSSANSLAPGATAQLTTTGTYSDGSTQTLTSGVTYASGNTAAVTVNAAGLVTAVAAGSATITATYQSQTATVNITVTAPAAGSLALTSSATNLAAGSTAQLQATETQGNGSTEDVTSQVTYTSSSPAVATVNATGQITAVSQGSAVITATYDGQSATITITVTATAPMATSLSLTSSAVSIAAGLTAQLQATAMLSDGSTSNVTGTATYTSSAPAVATISSSGLVTGVSVGSAVLTASYQGQFATTNLTITAAIASSIALTSSASNLTAGLTAQLQATATYSNGTTGDVSSSATYTSSNPSVATVSASGQVTAVSVGSAVITATYEGKSKTVTITVTAATAQSISVTPGATQFAKGTTTQLQTTATLSDGTAPNVTSQATYTSSAPAVATINSSGVVTGVSIGTAVITASYQGKTATTTLTITAATATSIALTSSSNNLPAGTTAQLQATATYTDGTTGDVSSSATYTSSNHSVATVSATGQVMSVSTGTAVITATYEGQSATVTITVSAATALSITVTAGSTQFAKGTTTQLQTTATLTNGTTQDVTSQATYTSSAPAVATVNSSGVVTGVSIGTAVITASYEGQTATATITITAAVATSIALNTSDSNPPAGSTAQLTATATYTDGTTGDVTSSATYSSSNASVATVDSSGQITAISQGSAVITATYEGQTATVNITVAPPALISITINPNNVQLANGTYQQLQALGSFTDGSMSDLTSTVTWATSPSVATIAASGLLTAVGTGTATITATQSGVSGTANLTVTAATLQSIVSLPRNPAVAAGNALQLTGQGIFTDASEQDITNLLSFATSDPSVATVSSSGLVTGVTPGSVTITATANPNLGSQSTSVTFIVTNATLYSINISPATLSSGPGLTQQFTALGTYSDGSTGDLTQSVTWASSNTNVAIIDAHGVATALNGGTAILIATIIGVPVTSATFTVTGATVATLAITPQNVSLAVGQNQFLSVMATMSDGTTQDVTQQSSLNISGGLGSIINDFASGRPFVQADAQGVGTISASLNGQTAQASLTVGPSQIIGISLPASMSVAVGSFVSQQVMGQSSDGSSQWLTTNLFFNSATPSIATVDALGDITGTQAGGPINVTATYNNPSGSSFSSTTAATVTPATLQGITIVANGSVSAVGIPIQLFVVGSYSDGSVQDLSTQTYLTSSNPSVAIVNSVGTVTPQAVGSTQISATLNGVTGTLSLNIGNAVVQSIAVTALSTLAVGESSHLTALGTFSDSSQQDVSSLVTWSSSNPSIGIVDTYGNMSGIAVGTANATATLEGISGQAAVQVTSAAPPTLTSITVTPNNVDLVGSVVNLLPTATQFTATGNYSDGSTLDLTQFVQWATSGLGHVDSDGVLRFNVQELVELVGEGQSTITIIATSGSVSGSTQMFLTVL